MQAALVSAFAKPRKGRPAPDKHAKESSQQPTRETATDGASGAVLGHGWSAPSSAEPLSVDKTLPTYDDVISDSGSACPYR